MLILLGTALLVIIALTIFLTSDRPDGNEGAGAVQPAPEQQVESEDVGAPVTPHRPSPPLEEPPVDQEEPVDYDDPPADQ